MRTAILEPVRLLFVGTGASGGTPGHGRSRRLESSIVISDGATLLIDVTRNFAVQAERLSRIDAVALTHVHRDAIGGLPALRRWWLANRAPEPIDVFLSEATAAVILTRYRHLEHCRLRVTTPGDIRHVGPFAFSRKFSPLRAGFARVCWGSGFYDRENVDTNGVDTRSHM